VPDLPQRGRSLPGQLVRWLLALMHLVCGLFISTFLFPLSSVAQRRAFIRHWSRRLLWIFGVHVQIRAAPGEELRDDHLLVCNHQSWLDIFVIDALRPTRLVAKSEVRRWPVLGWLCTRAGTIYVDRSRPRALPELLHRIGERIRAGEAVGFFPEGAVSAPGTLLPFHANLFEAACGAGVPVQPCVLCYLRKNGSLEHSIRYMGGITIFSSFGMILRGEPIIASFQILDAVPSAGRSRREVCQEVRQRMADVLLATPNRH